MTTLCEEQCQKLGLELSAMAIMANNAGCICTPNASQVEANDQTKASSVSAGMVTIMLQREANRRENAARNEAVERL
ncbi:MAG: hypothetical protein KTR25_11110 [Myxococcales bacterium]|nr:hypothetical protein [Myxococcales bacterium]